MPLQCFTFWKHRKDALNDVGLLSDQVSLLLKDSFIDSFPSKDRPFMKVFFPIEFYRVISFLYVCVTVVPTYS